jgi:hypothetical protein
MAQEWYYEKANAKHGPIPASRLKELAMSGELRPTDLVWRTEMKDGQPAAKVKGLFDATASAIPPPLAQANMPASKKKLILWTCAGGMAFMVMCSGILGTIGAIGSKAKSAKKSSDIEEPQTKTLKDLTVASGRVQIDDFIKYMKQKESLELSTPKEGSDIDGTPFEFLNKELKEPCRIHVGGRDARGQRVSAILVETTSDRKLAVAILGTPFDIAAGPRFGNDINSLSSFIKTMLPECNLREIFRKQNAKLALGSAATEVHGKATVSVVYDKGKKELRATIAIDR